MNTLNTYRRRPCLQHWCVCVAADVHMLDVATWLHWQWKTWSRMQNCVHTLTSSQLCLMHSHDVFTSIDLM